MKNMKKYKPYFRPKIGQAATMSYADWQAYLAARRAAKAAGKAAKAAGKAANGSGKLLKTGTKLGKALPGVGAFLTAVGWGLDVSAKGAVAGTANSAIDAIPFVGGGKILIELWCGKDFIPNK